MAGMGLLVLAHHAVVFLFGWEIMALSAFLLVVTEDEKAETRKAGLVYLVAAHVGTLALFGLFALWKTVTGSFELVPAPADTDLSVLTALFLLALVGFGLKAGLVPLHFWLPGAHANAPTHVSAILSGVVLKMGIYGLIRILGLLPAPPAGWGGLVLGLGAVSGLLGVVFALAQHDLKRLLAYHSVENIGIILMGLGLALLGRATGHAEWVVLGLAGCLLHVWNHSLFKSLLFFGAGSVLLQTETRNIDRLGGLAKTMPVTSIFFLVGAVAICGLPPLNGFVSEWMIFLGLFGSLAQGGSGGLGVAFVVPVLATVGALALACFVKVFAAVFLGLPRNPAPRPRESGPSILVPMAVLAGLCVALGAGTFALTTVLDGVIALWQPGPAGSVPLASLAPLGTLALVALGIWGILGVVAGVLRFRRARPGVTWDCGYVQPTGRMQYTASSLARSITKLFHGILRPREHRPRLQGAFPQPSTLESHVDELVLDRVLAPASRGLDRWGTWFHRFQKGLAQLYILYILVALILLLLTLVPFQDLWVRWLAR